MAPRGHVTAASTDVMCHVPGNMLSVCPCSWSCWYCCSKEGETEAWEMQSQCWLSGGGGMTTVL